MKKKRKNNLSTCTQVPTWLAILISLAAVLASYLVADRVFERMAHLEDEQAFVWQARVLARGKITAPSPPQPESFLWPFVVDYKGQRFGKYPLGWPVVLSLGELLDIRALINPLLAGLGVWLTFLIGKRTFGDAAGLLGAGLTLTSPFFLIISGSLLSHPLGLVLSAGFVLAWLEAFLGHSPDRQSGGLDRPATDPISGALDSTTSSKRRYLAAKRQWLAACLAGALLGALALTRPWTAVGVGLPFALHGLYLLVRGDHQTRLRLVTLGSITLVVAGLHFAWQWMVTGDPFLNPYTLWWPYDKIGFGPGHGVKPGGHSLATASMSLRQSFSGGFPDLFGWGSLSWIFLPFGIIAAIWLPKNRALAALLSATPLFSLILVYLAYWVGAYLLGPRYYFEGLYSLAIFSAAGILWLAGWPQTHLESSLPSSPSLKHKLTRLFSSNRARKVRMAFVFLLVGGLVVLNLSEYLPGRLKELVGLYGVSQAHTQPFLTEAAKELTPALVIVHPQKKWIEYGTLLELESPFLDSPFIFAISHGIEADMKVAAAFPDRAVYNYYPQEPGVFYKLVR